MCAPTPPSIPSAASTAAAQTTSNIDTAKAQTTLNNVNQVTPYGNLTYTQNGTDANGIPRYTATTTLSPAQQALLDTSNQTKQSLSQTGLQEAQRLPGLLDSPLDLSSPNIDKYTNTHFLDTFNQQQDRNQELLDAKLANQGIQLGSAAYTNAQRDFADQRNSALNSMLSDSQGNAINAILQQRETPINEISALAGGSQVATPTFNNTPQTPVAGTNVAGITANATNANLANYQYANNQYQSTLGGLFGLGSSALMAFSDERLKENIEKEGELPDGTNVYSYDFKPGTNLGTGRQLGVMAQEVEKTNPGAVVDTPSGYKAVDYRKVVADAIMKRAA
jgi:hypothetical protein